MYNDFAYRPLELQYHKERIILGTYNTILIIYFYIKYIHWSQDLGGFQLLDLIITELKSHMTCYNSKPLIGWNNSIQTGEQIL